MLIWLNVLQMQLLSHVIKMCYMNNNVRECDTQGQAIAINSFAVLLTNSNSVFYLHSFRRIGYLPNSYLWSCTRIQHIYPDILHTISRARHQQSTPYPRKHSFRDDASQSVQYPMSKKWNEVNRLILLSSFEATYDGRNQFVFIGI